MASPLFIFAKLNIHSVTGWNKLGIKQVEVCDEDWPVPEGRIYFSIFALCFQYILPILIISGANIRIYYKLKNRMPVLNIQSTQRNEIRERRMRRTNKLLIRITVVFVVCWLPLNVFNLYKDAKLSARDEIQFVTYALCHLAAICSACLNPVLYGFCNQNFRKEFEEILRCLRNRLFIWWSQRPVLEDIIETSRGDVNLAEHGLEQPLRPTRIESVAITDKQLSIEMTSLVL